MFKVIANKRGTNEWFNCEVKGRVKSAFLDELIADENFLKLYDKSELESQYFDYYIFKSINKKTL